MLPSTAFFSLKNQAEMREAPVDQMQLTAWVPIPTPLQPSQTEDLTWHVQTTCHLTEEVDSSVYFNYQGIKVSSFTFFLNCFLFLYFSTTFLNYFYFLQVFKCHWIMISQLYMTDLRALSPVQTVLPLIPLPPRKSIQAYGETHWLCHTLSGDFSASRSVTNR